MLSHPMGAAPHEWELPWPQVLGLDLGAGWRGHTSESGPNNPALLLGISATHPQKNPQTDPYPAPGWGQQLDHPEQLSPALFISQLVKPSPRKQENLSEQLSPTAGEQRQEEQPSSC